jgi:hypothetical protein
MKFLKTLQKKQSEQASGIDAVDNVVPEGKHEKFGGNKPPELFVKQDLRIGHRKRRLIISLLLFPISCNPI